MKQDMFDDMNRQKKAGGAGRRGRGPPECPRSDSMSPFTGLAFTDGEAFVKLSTSWTKCQKLISVGGANFSELTNASRSCGPAGEFKRRMAENLSAVFFQGGWDWVRHENESIEV